MEIKVKYEYSLVFSASEGWALVGALREYAERNPRASDCNEWKKWADILEGQLRK